MRLAQELLLNIQCSGGGSRSFVKELRALTISVVAGHWKLTVISWEPSSSLILLQLHEKLPKNSTLIILWLFDIWSKLVRWKSLIRGCLMSWSKGVEKNLCFEVLFSLILCSKNKSFLNWIVMWVEKLIILWQPAQQLDWVKVLAVHLSPTLCNPIDYNLPGSSVHRIIQAWTLQWGVIPFSGNLPYTGIEHSSPALQADSLTFEPLGIPCLD